MTRLDRMYLFAFDGKWDINASLLILNILAHWGLFFSNVVHLGSKCSTLTDVMNVFAPSLSQCVTLRGKPPLWPPQGGMAVVQNRKHDI